MKKFIRGLHNLPPPGRGVVATIGTFDGIHLGHQAILAQVREKAAELDLPSVVMIFEPQPREFFSGEQAPARLMRLREKVAALFEAGCDQVFCLQFNRHLRSLSARQFIEQVLVNGIGVRCLVVGDDFRFGCDRKGDYAMLESAAEQYGFEVLETRTVVKAGGRISSTRIRRLLEQGDFAQAEALLGRPYSISGRVVPGQRLGQKLGVPTANLNLQRHRAPLAGVFVVEVQLDGANGKRLPAVANVGVRPTIGDRIKPLLEVHLLDWSGNLYGRRIQVIFRQRIRAEESFAGIDELVANIRQDIDKAREYFSC